MKKTILFIMILAVVFSASACSIIEEAMSSTVEVDEDNFTIVLPSSNQKLDDQDNSYYIDNKDMYVEFFYYPKEFDMDGETIMNILVSYQFPVEDIVDIDETEIDGVDVYQIQYRTLTTGIDNIHYYYSGVYSVFDLDREFFVLDVYQYMEESVGINTYVSDEDLKLMHDMTNTVKIKGHSGEADYATEAMVVNTLSVDLSTYWAEVGDDNGYQDWGYFTEYKFGEYPLYVDVYEYNEDYPTDMTTLLDTYATYPEYTYYGEAAIGGEPAYVFTYGYVDESGTNVYGAFAESEHYYVDIYFYTVLDDYYPSTAMVDSLADFVSSVQ